MNRPNSTAGGWMLITAMPSAIATITTNGTERLKLDVLEAVERHVGHHRQPGVEREAEGRPGQPRPVLDAAKPWLSITQMKPITSAAAAGLGRPWKKRLSTTPMLVLKRASRSAAHGAVDERGDPARLAEALAAPTRRRSAPARRRSETMSDRLSICSPNALCVLRHARDAAVEAVEHHRAKMPMAACSKRPFIAITIA